VGTELQADCFAGGWANRANAAGHIREQGNVESGLNAASAIGDDRLQIRASGYVEPDSFTPGSSAQRGPLVPARPSDRRPRAVRDALPYASLEPLTPLRTRGETKESTRSEKRRNGI
jgi:hypothetical protein